MMDAFLQGFVIGLFHSILVTTLTCCLRVRTCHIEAHKNTQYMHWVQSKRHRLWFSTNTVYLLLYENSCKQHAPHPHIEFDLLRNIYIKSGLR